MRNRQKYQKDVAQPTRITLIWVLPRQYAKQASSPSSQIVTGYPENEHPPFPRSLDPAPSRDQKVGSDLD
jgi:hypothetical protein